MWTEKDNFVSGITAAMLIGQKRRVKVFGRDLGHPPFIAAVPAMLGRGYLRGKL
jgi:hypothetical protein